MESVTAPRWAGVTANDTVSKLPQPYRFLANIVGEILSNVDDGIYAIQKKRETVTYEYGIDEVQPCARIEAIGSVTCISGGTVFAIGTMQGQLEVIDPVQKRSLTSLPAFDAPITSVKQTSHGSSRLAVTKEACNVIYMYHLLRGSLTSSLSPLYSIRVPLPGEDISTPELDENGNPIPRDEPKEEEEVVEPTPAADGGDGDENEEPDPEAIAAAWREKNKYKTIQQIEISSDSTHTWIFALLKDVYIWAAPVLEAEADRGPSKTGETVVDTIPEHPEEVSDAWSTKPTMTGCACVYIIRSPWDNIPVEISLAIPTNEVGFCRGKFLFFFSQDNDHIMTYIVPPVNVKMPKTWEETNDFLPGVFVPERTVLEIDRRWNMGRKVSACASSPSHTGFGTENGAVHVFCNFACRLQLPLPAHFAKVTCLQFSSSEYSNLVSGSEDHWIHIYDCVRMTLVQRHLYSPPPSRAPIVSLTRSETMILGRDAECSLRLFDMITSGKAARIMPEVRCNFIVGSTIDMLAAVCEYPKKRQRKQKTQDMFLVELFDVAALQKIDMPVQDSATLDTPKTQAGSSRNLRSKRTSKKMMEPQSKSSGTESESGIRSRKATTIPEVSIAPSARATSSDSGSDRGTSTARLTRKRRSKRGVAHGSTRLTADSLERFDDSKKTKRKENVDPDLWHQRVRSRLLAVHSERNVRANRIQTRLEALLTGVKA